MALGDMGLILDPFWNMWVNIVGSLPYLVAAILIIILGYLVGALLGHIVRHLLEKTKIVNVLIKKIGLEEEIGKLNIAGFLALAVKWYIFVVFLNPAAEIISLTGLSNFLSDVAKWIPNIILAVIIAMAGYVLAEYLAKKIKDTRAKKNSIMATVAKILTMVLVVLVSLKQIGIHIEVAENSFLIVLAGIMLGVGIAFGFAFKDEAKGIIKEIQKRI
jgi:hypothetical protein